jgi:hypothetical protein
MENETVLGVPASFLNKLEIETKTLLRVGFIFTRD